VKLLGLAVVIVIGMASASACSAQRAFNSTQAVVNYCAASAVYDALADAKKQGVSAAVVRSSLMRLALQKAVQSCAAKHDVVCIPYQDDYQCEDSHFGDGLDAYGLESIGLGKAFDQLIPGS
jgi:hypothetical protein